MLALLLLSNLALGAELPSSVDGQDVFRGWLTLFFTASDSKLETYASTLPPSEKHLYGQLYRASHLLPSELQALFKLRSPNHEPWSTSEDALEDTMTVRFGGLEFQVHYSLEYSQTGMVLSFPDGEEIRLAPHEIDPTRLRILAKKVFPSVRENGVEWALYRVLNPNLEIDPEIYLKGREMRAQAWSEIGFEELAGEILSSEKNLTQAEVFDRAMARILGVLAKVGHHAAPPRQYAVAQQLRSDLKNAEAWAVLGVLVMIGLDHVVYPKLFHTSHGSLFVGETFAALGLIGLTTGYRTVKTLEHLQSPAKRLSIRAWSPLQRFAVGFLGSEALTGLTLGCAALLAPEHLGIF